MENFPFFVLCWPPPLLLSCPVLSSSPGAFFGHGFQRSSLPHPCESLTSSLKGEPQAVTQTVTLSCNCCSNFTWGWHGLEWRAEISFHLVSARLIYSCLHVTPWVSQLFWVCTYMHVSNCVCHRASLMTLYTAAGGWLRIRAKRPFPFSWEDEWPCLKVAAYGLRAIRVCCEPATLTALCTKAGPPEKEKYAAHNPFCWNQHSTVMVNKLNVSHPPVQLFCPPPPPRFHLSRNLERKKKCADYRTLRKAHQGYSFEISIFDLGSNLACGFAPKSRFWSSFSSNFSAILKETVNSGTAGSFTVCLLISFYSIVIIEEYTPYVNVLFLTWCYAAIPQPQLILPYVFFW